MLVGRDMRIVFFSIELNRCPGKESNQDLSIANALQNDIPGPTAGKHISLR